MLADLAHKKGKTVVATIHSPNSQAYALFDRLYLLMDGYCVYQGEAKDATQYFAKLGHKIHKAYNPPDFFMKLLTINYPKNDDDIRKIAEFDEFYASNLTVQVAEESAKFSDLPSFEVKGVERANVFKRFASLLKRAFIGISRDPQAGRARMG